MRGTPERQDQMFTYVSVEERVPADHPLRPIEERRVENVCNS